MKTKQIQVKTIYDIEIEFKDFTKIFTEAKNDPTRIDAFQDFNLDDTTIGNLRDCFKNLSAFCFDPRCEQACKDLRYIVRKLGFDNIENYGGFFKGKETYSITVSNNGADI